MDLGISAAKKKGQGRSISVELSKTGLPNVVARRAARIFNEIPHLDVIKKEPRREAIFFCSHEAYHALKNENPERRTDYTIDPEMLCKMLTYRSDRPFMVSATKRLTHKTGYRHIICDDTIEDFVQLFFRSIDLENESLPDLMQVTHRVLEKWPDLREKVVPQVAAAALVRYFLLINGSDLSKEMYDILVKKKDVITKLSNEIGRIDSGMP